MIHKPRPSQIFYRTASADFCNPSLSYMNRTSGIGAANSKLGTISFWYRPPTTPPSGTQNPVFLAADGSYSPLAIGTGSSSKRIYISLNDDTVTPTNAFIFGSTNNAIAYDGVWRHVLASWNTDFSAGNKLKHIYINDVDVLGGVTTDVSPAFDIVYNVNNWAVSNTPVRTSSAYMDGVVAEPFFTTTTYTDFSLVSNRRKFITATKRPVYLGVSGEKPFGASPAIYLKGSGSGFNINSGNGGDFTTTGTLATSVYTPST